MGVLAIFSNEHPYGLQVFTLWLAVVPVILLFALIAGTLLRRFHRHRHAQHQELLNKLLDK